MGVLPVRPGSSRVRRERIQIGCGDERGSTRFCSHVVSCVCCLAGGYACGYGPSDMSRPGKLAIALLVLLAGKPRGAEGPCCMDASLPCTASSLNPRPMGNYNEQTQERMPLIVYQ